MSTSNIYEEYKTFCLRDADWYESKAKEAREADPETYYKESLKCAQILCQVLPIIVKKSLESEEFKEAERAYVFEERVRRLVYFPRLRDAWRYASIATLDFLKGLVSVCPKLYHDLRKLVGL
jgi:hypothetical protein